MTWRRQTDISSGKNPEPMNNRRIYAPLSVGALGLSLLLGGTSAAAAPIEGTVTASYSHMVLNVGATDLDRNFAWYSDAAGAQQLKLAVKGAEAGTARILEPTASGTSNEQPGLSWQHAAATGLTPGATYVWQVGSDALGWSDLQEFSIQSDEKLDVLVYGDTQIGSGGGVPSDVGAWQETLDASLQSVPAPDFLLSVGDQVDDHDSDSQYDDYLSPSQLRQHSLATNIGNHDDGSVSYAEHFNMPNEHDLSGWDAGLGNYWYIQNDVLFVSLNSNEQDPAAHSAWVRDIVEQHGTGVDWKVATWHHGLYSTASHATDGDIEKRREWMPQLMSELNFDLVLSGHDHVYTRSHLLNQGHAVGNLEAPAELAKQDGEVLYLTMNSSTGSKYYSIQEDIDFTFNAVESQNRKTSYSHLQADGDSLRVTTRQVDGTVLDDVTLTRAAADAVPNPVPDHPAQTVFEGPGYVDKPVENVVNPDTGEVSVEARVLSANDDVEEYVANGRIYLDSSDLEITQESPGSEDPETQNIGIRFDQVAIPAGATVTGAYLQFTTDEPNKNADPFDVAISQENTGHAARYTEDAYNVSNREFLDDTVAWTGIPSWTTAGEAGEAQRTPDLTGLVQSVVDREDWASGAAMAFKLTGTGTRTAEAYEGGTGEEAPKLMVTYTLDGATEIAATIQDARDDVEQYSASGKMDHGSSDLEIVDEKESQIIGLRYAGLQIPSGAEILSARVQFTTDEEDKNTDPFNISIAGEAAGSSAAFGDTAFELAGRELTKARATWADIAPWLIEHEAGADQRTVDLSNIVQEIVDREDWAAGNALSFLLSGTGLRSAESADGEPTMAPKLNIVFRAGETVEPKPGKPGKPDHAGQKGKPDHAGQKGKPDHAADPSKPTQPTTSSEN
jgi:hypothetical protein